MTSELRHHLRFRTSEESNGTYIFGKHITRAIQNTVFIDFGQVFEKLLQYKCNLTTFGMGYCQIWSYHVTQAKNCQDIAFPI